MMVRKNKDPFSILLVVEDVKRRNNLSSRLRSQKCSVEASTGGFHTMSLLEEKPDYYEMVMIIDHMPDMNAYEQVSLIRTTYSEEQLKILYLYPRSEIDESISVQAVGANDIVEDNDRFDAVIKVIEKYR